SYQALPRASFSTEAHVRDGVVQPSYAPSAVRKLRIGFGENTGDLGPEQRNGRSFRDRCYRHRARRIVVESCGFPDIVDRNTGVRALKSEASARAVKAEHAKICYQRMRTSGAEHSWWARTWRADKINLVDKCPRRVLFAEKDDARDHEVEVCRS